MKGTLRALSMFFIGAVTTVLAIYGSWCVATESVWYLESREVGMPFFEYREMRLHKLSVLWEEIERDRRARLQREAAEWRAQKSEADQP